jgi:hypothetical protein
MNTALPITYQDAVAKVISIIKKATYSFQLTHKHIMLVINDVVTGNYDRVHKIDTPNQKTCSALSVYVEAVNTLLNEGFLVDITPEDSEEDVFGWGNNRTEEIKKENKIHNRKSNFVELMIVPTDFTVPTGYSDGVESIVYVGTSSNPDGDCCQCYEKIWFSQSQGRKIINTIYAPFCMI